jgi:hypothetical protein
LRRSLRGRSNMQRREVLTLKLERRGGQMPGIPGLANLLLPVPVC